MMRTAARWTVWILAAALLAPLSAQMAQQPGDQDAPPSFRSGGRMVRGTVTAVSANQLTVRTEAGETFQIALSANTRLRKGRDPVKAADVHIGDGVGAMGELDPATKTLHALFIGVVGAEQIKQARENLGKTYIAGKVLAVEGTNISVLRADNVHQTIAVDEDTSFRKGGRGMRGGFGGLAEGFGDARPGEPDRAGGSSQAQRQAATADEDLTLADVKVGDMVAGPGAVRNGVFVASKLGIVDPAAQRRARQRARPPNASDGSSPSPVPEQ